MSHGSDLTDPRTTLVEVVASGVADQYFEAHSAAEYIVSAIVEITPPLRLTAGDFAVAFPDMPGELVKVGPGGHGGWTAKPGNIVLNWRKLLPAIGEVGLTAVGLIAVPWLIPLGALMIWRELAQLSHIPLSNREAAVIWALWVLKDDTLTVSRAGLPGRINAVITPKGHVSINSFSLMLALRRLRKLRCIENTRDDRIRLREILRVEYQ